MATLTALAERLGVSEATVSNALAGKGRMKPETREMILVEAKKEGYQIRHSIKKMIKKVIVVTEDITEFTSPIINGITKSTQEVGVCWPVYNLDIWGRSVPRNAGADILRPLLVELMDSLEFRPSGLIYISQYPRKIPGLFSGLNIPVVVIQAMECDADVYINFDNQQGAYEAVRYLAQRGKSRIATLSGNIDTYSSSERMIGYQRALIDSSLLYHPKLIWLGDWLAETGYQLTNKLMDMSEPPDAIFAQNDGMAKGAIVALNERKIQIPEEVAVIGFDNMGFAEYLFPALSSIALPRFEMGWTACQSMCDLLSKKKVQDVVLSCRLVLRESC